MKLPPGPNTITDLIKLAHERKKHPIRLYENLFQKYGDIVYFHYGSNKYLLLNDADTAEQVLHTESKNYTKSIGYERIRLILGNGLLASEGDFWRRQRRLLSWAFSTRHIERVHPIMARESLEMVKRWKGQKEVDLAEEMTMVTLQIISLSLFGQSQIESFRKIRKSLQILLDYLQDTRYLLFRGVASLLPVKDKKEFALSLEKKLPAKASRDFFDSLDYMNEHVLKIIEERKKAGSQNNFLDTLIEATDSEDQTKMSSQQIKDEVMTMLIAGHETTANALTWTWQQLLRHPEVLQKVREEVKSLVKGDTVSFEDVPKLIYTQAVLEESMRLHPPFWRIARRNIAQTNIRGFDIPEGTNIAVSIYTLHRKPQYWDEPEKFIPERFLNKDKNQHRFSYIPFGAGPRTCVGMQFAMIEAITILATCIRHFDFKLLNELFPEYSMHMTLSPKEGCKVRIEELEG